MKNTIKYNPIYAKASRDLIPEIKKILRYKTEYWIQGQYRKEQTEYYRYLIDGRNGNFPAGLLPKIKNYLISKKIKFKIDNSNFEKFSPDIFPPSLKNIELRTDQLKACEAVKDNQRGVIIAPTGSGKTIVASAVIKMYHTYSLSTVLFLCHTIDLLKQTSDEFKKFNFNHEVIGGGKKYKGKFKENIILSTIQSFSKINPEDYFDTFDIVVVDECHHCVSMNSQYGKVLTSLYSPIKIGFTATMPNISEKQLTIEGLFGPVISELELQEAIDIGILAKPKLNLVPVPYSTLKLYRYKDIYNEKIVNNRTRNLLILKEANKTINNNDTVLIMVEEIKHGQILKQLAEEVYGLKIEFIFGIDTKEKRNAIKQALKKKQIKCVIVSKIWREGINIPSLNHVINACGGKGEIKTLQALGRGLRTSKGKTEILLTDFLDPYRYLAEHSIARLNIYLKEEWL
jgi:superfamily II DNA or RNA helicase